MSATAAISTQARMPAASGGSSWLVSPWFDGLFFLASALSVVACWQASLLPELPGQQLLHIDKSSYILALVAVISNGPHLTSTWTRVYLDTRELRRRPFVYVGGPFVVGAVIVALLLRGQALESLFPGHGPGAVIGQLFHDPFRLLNSAVLYWATYHFAAQCYGLARLYQRRSGEAWRPAHRAESVFIFSTSVSGILWRLCFGPRWLFGAEAIAPPIPVPVVVASIAIVVGSLGWVLVDQISRALAGHAVAWTRLAFLAATLCGFWVPFFLIKDGTAAFAAAACWHGFQYLGIVYHYNRRKWGNGASGEGARVISWVSQARRWPFYSALLLAMAGSGFVMIKALSFATGWTTWMSEAAVWMTLTFSHYLIDGFIWKMRRGDVATTLQAGAPSLAAA